MDGIMKSVEGIGSPTVLGIAAGVGAVWALWPKVQGMIVQKLPSSLGAEGATALTNGVGAVAALARTGQRLPRRRSRRREPFASARLSNHQP